MIARAARRPWRPWLWIGLPLCLLYLLPLWLLCPYDHIDSSIEWILNDGLAQGRRFGHDLVWTNGPLGVLWADQYHPQTWTRALVLRLPFALAFWWSIGTVVFRRLGLPRLGGLLLAFGLLLVSLYTRETAVYVAGALWWLMAPRPEDEDDSLLRPRLALVVALAPLALGKFTLLLMLAPMLLAHAAARGLMRRLPTIDGLVLLALLPPLWLLSGQPLAGFLEWIGGSLEVIGAYAEGIPVRGDLGEVVAMLALASVPAGWLVWSRTHRSSARSLATWVDLGAPLALVALVLRHGLTRQDHGHVAISGAALLGVGALFLAGSERRRIGLSVGAALAAVFLGVTGAARGGDSTMPAVLRRASTLPDRVRTLVALGTGQGPGEVAGCEDALAVLRNAFPLTPPDGSVDLYPHDQVVLAAHELEYAPRPVPQSYSAYSPSLQDRNAEYVAGDHAPSGLLFDIAPTDDFHPALADARSWTAILANYDVGSLGGSFLTLQRRSESRAVRVGATTRVAAQLGEPVSLPDVGEGLLWMQFDLHKSLVGHLAAAVLKPPELRIAVQLEDGRVSTHRLTPSFARAGFFVSPHVDNRLAFAALVAENGRASGLLPRVRAVRIDAASLASAYDHGFEIEMHTVEVGVQEGLTVPDGLAWLARAHALPLPGPPRPHWLDVRGELELFAHAPSHLQLPMAQPPRSLRVEFGFLDGAWKGPEATDGADFVLAWRMASGELRPIARLPLDPATKPADRGVQRRTVPVPPMPAGQGTLELVVEQRGALASDWTYWGGLEVR